MDVLLDIFGSANFWAAAIRIATPLIFGVLGAQLCDRLTIELLRLHRLELRVLHHLLAVHRRHLHARAVRS